MSDFNIKDIIELIETTSKSGDTAVAVAVPTGGGNYNLRHITKENLFIFNEESVPTRENNGAGPFRVLNVNNLSNFLEYYVSEGRLALRGNEISVSGDGTNFRAKMKSTGEVETNFLRVNQLSGAGTYTIICTATTAQAALLDRGGVIATKPKTFRLPLADEGTYDIEANDHSVYFLDSTGSRDDVTFNFPDNPKAGDKITFYTPENITNLTLVAGADSSIILPITSLSADENITYCCVVFGAGPTRQWIKIG